MLSSSELYAKIKQKLLSWVGQNSMQKHKTKITACLFFLLYLYQLFLICSYVTKTMWIVIFVFECVI